MLFRLEPDLEDTAELLLFTNLRNAGELRASMMRGEFSAAFVDAQLVVDEFEILVAVSTALLRMKQDAMSTRNVFTEIVYNLSGTRNMSKALSHYGLSATSTSLLVAVPNPTATELSRIRASIQGTEHASIREGLKQVSDCDRIRKLYGISEAEEHCGSLVDSVVTRMACRDIR